MKPRKYIKINKLFGKYDNEIDLSSRAIIFIGENGVGKTTIMKILQYLMNLDFNELIKYDFESIYLEATTKNGKILKETIKYNDLLPSNETIKELIKKSDFFFSDLSDEWDSYVESIPDEDKLDEINNNWSGIESWTDEEKIDAWNDFDFGIAYNEANVGDMGVLSNEILNDLIKKNEFKNIIRKIIKNDEIDDLYYNNYINGLIYKEKYNEYEFEDSKYKSHTVWQFKDIQEGLEKVISEIRKYIENILTENTEVNFDNKKNVIRILKIIIDNIDKPVSILDMTKIYQFNNSLLPSSLIKNKWMEWESNAPSIYQMFLKDVEIEICKNLLEDWDWNYDFLDESKDISELNIDNLVNINSILKHYFYNEDFIESINKSSLECYINSKNDNLSSNNNNKEFNDIVTLKDIFIKYVRPIIVKNSPFDMEWDSYFFEKYGSWKSDKYKKYLYDFCTVFSQKYIENINPKIKILQELLSKYMMNKDVEVTPMGLLVKSKDDNREIPLNSLSSGEKKLLVIFLHCLFNEDVPIIIDEPEISLSIIWQENLLPDLLEKTNIKQIIVATHSSAVISDPILDKYIIPLPNALVDRRDENE